MTDYQPYILDCRARIPGFVNHQFGLKGAARLNRHAWGRDILIAPFNFFMGVPNFMIKLLALVLSLVRLHRPASWLSSLHLGIKTQVQSQLAERLMSDVFALDRLGDDPRSPLIELLDSPLETYLQTRNVAADITAGTFAAILGLFLFSQFTPGSISAGAVIADWAGKEHAITSFTFGETLGGIWYSLFHPETPVWLIVLCFAVVMLIVSVASAFAGFVHDPVQKWTGLHHRRLNKLLDGIERILNNEENPDYRPKDTFVGRVYDVIDWFKGVFG